MDEMAELNAHLEADSVAVAQSVYKLRHQAGVLLATVSVFARCLLSVNGRDSEAGAFRSLRCIQKRHAVLGEPLSFLDRADDAVVAEFLEDESLSECAFEINHARAR